MPQMLLKQWQNSIEYKELTFHSPHSYTVPLFITLQTLLVLIYPTLLMETLISPLIILHLLNLALWLNTSAALVICLLRSTKYVPALQTLSLMSDFGLD